MLISVTQEDIDKGVPYDPNKCPVYLAAKKAGLDIYGAYPRSGLHIRNIGYVRFSERVSKFMTTYDQTGKMVPFKFRVQMKEGES